MTEFGPEYPRELGPTVAKFRRAARKGLRALSIEERRRYGDAVEQAILAKQRSEINRGLPAVNPTINCASGTNHTTGEAIHNAIRARQIAALRRAPAQERAARTDVEWRQLYEEAMQRKHGSPEAKARAEKLSAAAHKAWATRRKQNGKHKNRKGKKK